eukprot:11134854-Ditylum_brightwellii.AAC.1
MPFTNDQLVTYTERLILGTGQHSNAYRSWLALPATSCTYQNLKSAWDAGYHSANLATEADVHKVSAQLEEAAQQFTAANTQGQETMSQLATTNAQLQQQVHKLQQQMNMQASQMMMLSMTNNQQRRN